MNCFTNEYSTSLFRQRARETRHIAGNHYVPEHVHTVGEVRAYLRERGDAWAEVLADGRALRMAYNQEMADAKTAISEGAEIAFFPPVTGG